MLNIFIPEISNIDIKNISKFLLSEHSEKILLCFDGEYKYINNKWYKFKITTVSNSDKVEKLNNVNIFCSQVYKRKTETTNRLPCENEYKLYKKQIYKLNPKSKNKFIVEFIDGVIKDYYFESHEFFSNKSLQEDISSFLSLLK